MSFTKRFTVEALPFHNNIIRSFEGPLKKNAISIMNFNLLAKCFSSDAVNKMMPFDTERRRLNVLHVQHMKPMILAVEEMDDCYIADFEAAGYETILATKKKDGSGEHTGLFFLKQSELKSLAVETHQVDQTGERGQFLIICHAFSSATNSDFIIIVTHAKAGRTEEMENTRVQHAKYTFEQILPDFLKRRSEATNQDKMNLVKKVLYIGDFNAGPHSYGGKYPCKIIPWLLGEKLEQKGETAIAGNNNSNHNNNNNNNNNNDDDDANNEKDENRFGKNPISLVSAQKVLNGNEHPLFTTCKERDGHVIVQTIDYIMMSSEFGTVVGGLETPSKNPEKDLAPYYLPCPEKWGSDHLSVYVDVEMK